MKGFIGAFGLSVKEVVQQINQFTDIFKELIFIELSHISSKKLSLPLKIYEDRDVTNADWESLFTILSGVKCLFQAPSGAKLTTLPLRTFIENQAVCPPLFSPCEDSNRF